MWKGVSSSNNTGILKHQGNWSGKLNWRPPVLRITYVMNHFWYLSKWSGMRGFTVMSKLWVNCKFPRIYRFRALVEKLYMYLFLFFSTELNRLHQESSTRTQLDMLRKDKNTKEEQIRRLYVFALNINFRTTQISVLQNNFGHNSVLKRSTKLNCYDFTSIHMV